MRLDALNENDPSRPIPDKKERVEKSPASKETGNYSDKSEVWFTAEGLSTAHIGVIQRLENALSLTELAMQVDLTEEDRKLLNRDLQSLNKDIREIRNSEPRLDQQLSATDLNKDINVESTDQAREAHQAIQESLNLLRSQRDSSSEGQSDSEAASQPSEQKSDPLLESTMTGRLLNKET